MVGRKYLLKPWMMICFTYILKEHARREFQLELPRHNAPGAKKNEKEKRENARCRSSLMILPASEEKKKPRGIVDVLRRTGRFNYARDEFSASRWARGSAGRSAKFGPQKKKNLGDDGRKSHILVLDIEVQEWLRTRVLLRRPELLMALRRHTPTCPTKAM